MDTGQLNLQLVELLTTLSDAPDARGMALHAARWTAEALDAELVAVVRHGAVEAGVGVRSDERDLLREVLAAVNSQDPVDLPSLPGALVTAVEVPLPDEDGALLVVARAEEPFEAAERLLLLGTGRLLAQALQSARALEEERVQRRRSELLAAEHEALLSTLQDREVLLSTLLELQRAISHRVPLEEVLDLLGSGALTVLGGDEVAVVLEDPLHPQRLRIGARSARPGARGCPDVLAHAHLARAGEAEVHGGHEGCSWRAAPVRAHGRVVGALVLLDAEGRARGREHLLTPLTAHASTALNDSYTATTLRESFYDQLTRLPNRSLFLDRLADSVAACGGGQGLALLYVDLDGFKGVNDRCGHAAGDTVLRTSAHRLREGLRAEDTAARLGGDEFAVVLHDADVRTALKVADRLLAALREPVEHEGQRLLVGASIGVAVLGHEGTSVDSLLRDADTAMYTLKSGPVGQRTGGVAVFGAPMQQERARRLELEADLGRAVTEGELVLHYQPTVALTDGRPNGCEALVRWQHPRRGLLGPAEFLPLAEASGLVVELGAHVLRQACRQVSRWRADGLVTSVAVNLAAAQLRPQLVGAVLAALQEADLPGEALVLEVTETSLVTEGRTAADVLQELRTHGVRIAVDDFGTGYSSLAYLRQLPVDVLKVDRSFVQRLGSGGADVAIVRTVLQLAQALGLTVVAEGIETGVEEQVLRELGCPWGQGFRYSRPLPPDGFAAWWTARVPGQAHAALAAS